MRKCELGKVMSKYIEKTYQNKIFKNRFKNKDTDEKCSISKGKFSFELENKWYNDNGGIYGDTKKSSTSEKNLHE